MDDVFETEIFRVLEKMIAEEFQKNYDYLVFVFKQVKFNFSHDSSLITKID
jgi:hypothetical protein